jgi:endonuclease/exonuclease/phosphatase family metal-dependent hydrolase
MEHDDSGTGTRVTRRSVLGGVVAGTLAGVAGTARAAPTRVTVMTRNLYLGADLFRLFRAESFADLRRIVGDLFLDIGRSNFDRRAEAIADELAATEPHLVGLQEAALVRTQIPSDYADTPEPNATTVRYDYLETLREALAARGLDYRVVAVGTNADFELPADVDGERRDVRLTDRDVVLARGDVATSAPETPTFETTLTLPVDDETVTIDRGYVRTRATVDGASFTFVNTHLESAATGIREEQARELRAALPTDERVALVGDFNSGLGASSAAIAHLTEAYPNVVPDGPTCCQASDLRNAESRLDARIDHVLAAGFSPVSVSRVGHRPADRVDVGDGTSLWPSDHAGVVATLEPVAVATPTPAESTTAEPTTTGPSLTAHTATPQPTTDGSAPGFGVGAGAVALLLGGYLSRRRDD